jgi:hypothetical protein
MAADSPFGLRRFAPPDETTFTLRKHGDEVFAVDGDPDVDDVAQMLRIENIVRGIDEGDSAAALTEGKALLLRLVRECRPDVTEMRIGPQELIVIFSLIVKGPSVAEAVMEAITASNAAAAAGRELDGDLPADGTDGDGDAAGAPLPSVKRSSGRSSSSAEQEAGLQAIGTA